MVDRRVGLDQTVQRHGVRFTQGAVECRDDAGGDGGGVAQIERIANRYDSIADTELSRISKCERMEIRGVGELHERHVVVGRSAQHLGFAYGAVGHLHREYRSIEGLACVVGGVHNVGVGEQQPVVGDNHARASGDRCHAAADAAGDLDGHHCGHHLGEQLVEVAEGRGIATAALPRCSGHVRDSAPVGFGELDRRVGNPSRQRHTRCCGAHHAPDARRAAGFHERRRWRQRRRSGEVVQIIEQRHIRILTARS
ncbi:unannotated protein [freshwater metagenome]|uniref:Unannotated protein n=1 Tax=freshwater metagenome TaxID=449393 RepID=A0A6J7C371_9ZZZZ